MVHVLTQLGCSSAYLPVVSHDCAVVIHAWQSCIVTCGYHSYQWLPMVTSGYSGYTWLQWLHMIWLHMVTVATRGYLWLKWLYKCITIM